MTDNREIIYAEYDAAIIAYEWEITRKSSTADEVIAFLRVKKAIADYINLYDRDDTQ